MEGFNILDVPTIWYALLAIGLLVLYFVLQGVLYLLDRIGTLCEKFNLWVLDEMEISSFIIFGILLFPIYIITSSLQYLGKLCENANELLDERHTFSNKKWISTRRVILNFLLGAAGLFMIVTIFATLQILLFT